MLGQGSPTDSARTVALKSPEHSSESVAERARALIRGGRRIDETRAAVGQLERAVERLEQLRRELRLNDLHRALDPCESAAIAWLNEVRNPRQLVAELEGWLRQRTSTTFRPRGLEAV